MRNSPHKEIMREAAAASRRRPAPTAQELCNELFRAVEGPMSDAWISDEASTDDPFEYLRFVRGHLAALDEARLSIKRFLKRHTPKER